MVAAVAWLRIDRCKLATFYESGLCEGGAG